MQLRKGSALAASLVAVPLALSAAEHSHQTNGMENRNESE
jgi:hypothetical protein